MKNRDITEQLHLFSAGDVENTSKHDTTDKRIELISFRELVPRNQRYRIFDTLDLLLPR